MLTSVQVGPFYYDFGPGGLGPGQAIWVSYVSSAFDKATIAITAYPMTEIAGSTAVATNTVSVGDIFVSGVPYPDGVGGYDIDYHAGANITNAGQTAIRYMWVEITALVRP